MEDELRERVIQGLKCCIQSDVTRICPPDCPYDMDKCEKELKEDALILLRGMASEASEK